MVQLGTMHILTWKSLVSPDLFRTIHCIHKWQTRGEKWCLHVVMKGGVAGYTKIANEDFQRTCRVFSLQSRRIFLDF